ncbi:MAG TPA: SDR family oxidoreductase [Gaiellaceae bacterium]|nr:SDR family oxidoreductase [Gaiellaceae bacterium]
MNGALSGRALVTGGGRGIGAGIARELAAAGMEVTVTGRTAAQVEAVAAAIAGRALVGDVSSSDDVTRWFADAGPVDLLVNNAGISGASGSFLDEDPDDWWHVLEVNLRGVYLCCRAAVPGMLERGGGRIVNVASGGAYLPTTGMPSTSYGPSKAAVHRFSELLAAQLTPRGIYVFSISPGLVRTAMTEGHFPDDAPWTPPECAPSLVAALASGEFDALAGRYLHAEHDPPESLRGRIDAILEDDLNAIRLRRSS